MKYQTTTGISACNNNNNNNVMINEKHLREPLDVGTFILNYIFRTIIILLTIFIEKTARNITTIVRKIFPDKVCIF